MADEDPAAASTVRRRLAAILAADVAGYSRLMEGDESATLAALDAARRVFRQGIEAHGGRVIDMAGDSVLALFESATAAVSAGLAIQRELALGQSDLAEDEAMMFRIGVHLGDVMEKSDGSIYGEGVNTAARLEGLAEPGQVAVSDLVYASVRGRLVARFDDLGQHSVKNRAESLHAWRASEATRAMLPKRGAAGSGWAANAPGPSADAEAARRLGDTRRVLPHLLLEALFALLPLAVLGASWPDDPAEHRSSFAASPAWPMTACYLYGLGLARLWPAVRGEGMSRQRHEGTAAVLLALLPLAGVIASVVLIGRLSAQPGGAASIALSFVNLALALLSFAVFGGYGMRAGVAPKQGRTP